MSELKSPLGRMTDAYLQQSHGVTLQFFLRDRRDGDNNKSLHAIADELRDMTGGAVDVSYQTVYRWSQQLGIDEPEPRNVA